jgi:ribonuclease P protein component
MLFSNFWIEHSNFNMYTFQKNERLCSKKLIAQLFIKGNRGVSRFPFRFTWVPALLDAQVPAQVLFVVPKRSFPKATTRNKIKRQLRELYRLHKETLYSQLGIEKQIAVSILYQGPSEHSLTELSENFATCIKLVCNDLEKNHPGPIYPAHPDL